MLTINYYVRRSVCEWDLLKLQFTPGICQKKKKGVDNEKLDNVAPPAGLTTNSRSYGQVIIMCLILQITG